MRRSSSCACVRLIFAEGGERLRPSPASARTGTAGSRLEAAEQSGAGRGARTLLLRKRSGRALQKLGVAAILQSERAGKEFISLMQPTGAIAQSV